MYEYFVREKNIARTSRDSYFVMKKKKKKKKKKKIARSIRLCGAFFVQ